MWNKNWKVKQNLAKIMTATSYTTYTITQEQCWFIKPDNSRIKTINWDPTSMNLDILSGGFLSYGTNNDDKVLLKGKIDSNDYNIGRGNSSYGWLLHVGSGTDTPTENDFNLKSQYSYGLDVKQIEAHISTSYDKSTLVARKTIDSVMFAHKDMTINEIGLSACINVSSGIKTRILFAREVLATPLNVTQGQTFQVSLSFEQTLDDIADVPPVVSANIQALNDDEMLNDETEVLNDEVTVL